MYVSTPSVAMYKYFFVFHGENFPRGHETKYRSSGASRCIKTCFRRGVLAGFEEDEVAMAPQVSNVFTVMKNEGCDRG